MSRRKAPKPEDAALWDAVVKTIEPLHPRRAAKLPPLDRAEPEKPRAGKPASPLPMVPAPPPAPTKPPALAPFDRRSRAKLTRGATAIDRRIDLHGLTQAAAHSRLLRFLKLAQEDGAKVVLVITGKGRPPGPAGGDERGVLKRIVPAWLSSPELRGMVVGFEPAGRAHGGEGALYVRIRRLRSG